MRRTGVTTRLIIEHVAHALDNPGTWVLCTDHYSSLYADIHMAQQVQAILDLLNVHYVSKGYSIRVEPIKHKEYPPS